MPGSSPSSRGVTTCRRDRSERFYAFALDMAPAPGQYGRVPAHANAQGSDDRLPRANGLSGRIFGPGCHTHGHHATRRAPRQRRPSLFFNLRASRLEASLARGSVARLYARERTQRSLLPAPARRTSNARGVIARLHALESRRNAACLFHGAERLLNSGSHATTSISSRCRRVLSGWGRPAERTFPFTGRAASLAVWQQGGKQWP
jgi:hypothetical protein